MKQIPNKILVFLLIVTIGVSVGSTIISINRLNQLMLQTSKITGLGATDTGKVNLSLAKTAAITIENATIDFGSCSPNSSYGSNLSSNISNSTTWESWGSPGVCTGFPVSPANITIKNTGNANVNVSVSTNALASSFIGGTLGGYGQAEMWFSARNSSNYPGCFNTSTGGHINPTSFDGTLGMQLAWQNFSVAGTQYLACANLTPTEDTNSMYVFIKIFLPADTPTGTDKNASLTFTATTW